MQEGFMPERGHEWWWNMSEGTKLTNLSEILEFEKHSFKCFGFLAILYFRGCKQHCVCDLLHHP